MEHQIVLNLGPALMPDFMTGASFHAILGWPTDDDAAGYHRVSNELAAATLRLTNLADPAAIGPVMDQWPQIDWAALDRRAQRPKPRLGYLRKRLDQRMAAARAGIGKLHDELFDKPAVLPPGMTALSIDQLCALIKSDVMIDDPENVEKHVWRKSLPIMHLAIATQLLLAGRYSEQAEIACDLQDIVFYREAVCLALPLEQVIHEHPDFAITRDKMTLVRWFE